MKSKITREKILIRTKLLATGNRSIYLECNHDGERIIEWLHLYLIPENSNADRDQNALTMLAAQNIRARRYEEAARRSCGPALVKHSDRDILLTEYIQQYADGQMKSGYASAQQTYRNLIAHINRVDANIRLKDVNRLFAEKLYDYLTTRTSDITGKQHTSTIIRTNYSLFAKIIRQATNEGKANFCALPLLKGPLGREPGTREALTYDELQTLINTPCRHERTRSAFLFSCATGLRWGDIKSLKWKEIVMHDDMLCLEKLQSKTKAYVYVPINELAKSVLPIERGDDDTLVFDLYENTAIPLKHLQEWTRDAGIDKHIVFYSGRHTFARLQFALGADLDTTRNNMGHRKIESTMRYTHLLEEKKLEVADNINRLFEERLKKRIVWQRRKR